MGTADEAEAERSMIEAFFFSNSSGVGGSGGSEVDGSSVSREASMLAAAVAEAEATGMDALPPPPPPPPVEVVPAADDRIMDADAITMAAAAAAAAEYVVSEPQAGAPAPIRQGGESEAELKAIEAFFSCGTPGSAMEDQRAPAPPPHTPAHAVKRSPAPSPPSSTSTFTSPAACGKNGKSPRLHRKQQREHTASPISGPTAAVVNLDFESRLSLGSDGGGSDGGGGGGGGYGYGGGASVDGSLAEDETVEFKQIADQLSRPDGVGKRLFSDGSGGDKYSEAKDGDGDGDDNGFRINAAG
jgi:hypothetical protein